MKKLLTVLLFFLLFTSFYCKQDDGQISLKLHSKKQQVGIVTSDFLTIRIDPYILSSIVGFLQKSEQVEIINISRHKSRISGKKYYWYKISKGGILGWVSGKYLSLGEKGDDEASEKTRLDLSNKEKAKIKKLLYGKFYSVDNMGIYTKEKILFFHENVYKFAHLHYKVKEGTYEIDSDAKEIHLSEGSSVGKTLNYVLAGSDLTLYGKRYKKTIRLVKASSNPEEDENENK